MTIATMRRVKTLLAAVLALALASCADSEPAKRAVALEDCRLPQLSTSAKCTTIEVPEDRSKPDGRRIGVFVAILPANTLSPKPDPLLILAGGPGQSATSLASFASRLAEVRRTRDIVLVDQRGTGRSAPLDCPAFDIDDSPVDALEVDPLPRATLCIGQLIERGTDVAQYTTEAFIADLEAVRDALGYARWNLWGGSYGTRVALEYLRRHGDRVRTLVLDGVAPPTLRISLGVWLTREQALDRLFKACAETPACAQAHPTLDATLERIRRTLGETGRSFPIVDPRTGERQSVHITYATVLAALHPLTYIPELAVAMPEIIERAGAGDYAPLFAVAQMVMGDFAEQMNIALHYTVTCTEDTPRVQDVDRVALRGLRSQSIAEKVLSLCDHWPKGRQPPDATQPVTSDVPALLLSGALDPVTPPIYAEEVGKTLGNHRHIVAGGYGHIVSPHACGPRLIAAFVDRAGFDRLPTSCIEHFENSTRPPLWANHLAPSR